MSVFTRKNRGALPARLAGAGAGEGQALGEAVNGTPGAQGGCGGATEAADRIWTADVIAGDLGVPVGSVRAVMKNCVAPGEVVMGRDGRAIATEAGREKIRQTLDAAMRGECAAVDPKAAEPAGRVYDTLLVTRLWGAKRVLANRESNGKEVVCCLQDSSKLMPGMRLEGAFLGVDGAWFYYGRLPRRRGRW